MAVSATPDIPRTKAEALAQALEWGHTRSHLNTMMAVESCLPNDESHGAYETDRQKTLVMTAQADAAEVQRLVALHAILPETLER